MDPVIQKAYEAALQGKSFAFATIIESTVKGTPRKTGSKMLVLADGTIAGTIGGGRNEKSVIARSQKALESGKIEVITYKYFGKEGQSICGGQIKVLIEPFAEAKTLVICGGGHIALPLSFLAKLLSFKVVIIDNRPEFANNVRFPHVDAVMCGSHVEQLSKIKINASTHIMIVTHGHEHDYACLRAVIEAPACYLGVISSLTKRIKFLDRLKKDGVSGENLKRIRIPAGLDLGSQTPEEIAVSIAAEMVALSNESSQKSDKFRQKLRA